MSIPATFSLLAWMPGPWELGIILMIVLIFFGIGKLPKVLGQLGSGVKAFKDGVREGEKEDIANAIDATPAVREESKVTEAEEVRA